MGKYISIGCCKCDFSEGESTKHCEKGLCNDYEESYIFDRSCDNPNIEYSSIEEFNSIFGTNYMV